jgi:hypothetical protein
VSDLLHDAEQARPAELVAPSRPQGAARLGSGFAQICPCYGVLSYSPTWQCAAVYAPVLFACSVHQSFHNRYLNRAHYRPTSALRYFSERGATIFSVMAPCFLVLLQYFLVVSVAFHTALKMLPILNELCKLVFIDVFVGWSYY